MSTNTELNDISAVGVELNEERLLGISGGVLDREVWRTGCYSDSSCDYDDIAL
ncbi:hypothetical protein [Planomonospora parontospora]|uniref:hypothetical protein n=1 Tax=Planomonospora parontospora TaxID=58119 RepID=UPI0016713689|nr:hypothetical protein [Planomonospora parontospora]GGL29200.1 hypothetical protein GCM10014719_33360 [Planomonospora parontospora subsp. antibiotica]GII19747.1 hypothetical protein Ppa05_64730 [Planomonospora parontospora subsp. antibiotica]